MTTHHDRQDRRTRITTAAITGLLAGAAKAITTWLIDHLNTG